MTLAQDVQNRIPPSRLVQLTNHSPEGTSAGSVDTTVLGYAVADAKAEFQRVSGIAYDESSANHVPLGVEGTMCYLIQRKGFGAEARAALESWQAALKRFGESEATGQRWFSPGTNAPYTSTRPESGERPDADRSRFDGLVPRAPSSFGTRRSTRTDGG